VIELTLENLAHVYPSGVRALDGVSLRVDPGETVALVGQNGSGKTTLVRHLNGLLRPTSGRVLVGGVDAAGLRVAGLAAQVGLAFQDPDRQIFAGSVQKEVEFGPRNVGLRGAALDEAVAGALTAVGLGGEEATNPYDLGAARRKLLAVASVLAMRTPILVLDEPTTGQDRAGVARIRDIVTRVAGEGRTVIAISHDLRFVAETFGRVVALRAGRVVLDGPPNEVFGASAWETLRATGLEPPAAAVIAERLGVGPVATEAALVGAVAANAGAWGPGAGS
jgi:energy-coupling factor transport system ATP-binding protein